MIIIIRRGQEHIYLFKIKNYSYIEEDNVFIYNFYMSSLISKTTIINTANFHTKNLVHTFTEECMILQILL